MPRLHAMVRSAVMRDRPLSPKREAQLEDGRFFHDEHLRRTGRAPKSEVEVRNRWEAGGDKVERVEKELRERRERREKQIVEARREREAQISEEREQEVAGAV